MKLGLKFFAILMVCVLFVAVMYGIRDLIAERQQLAERVNHDIAEQYVSSQRVLAPFALIPIQRACSISNTAQAAACKPSTRWVSLAADTASWHNAFQVDDKSLKRGIYRSMLFHNSMNYQAQYDFSRLSVAAGEQIDWAQALWVWQISDQRGLNQAPTLDINGQKQTLKLMLQAHPRIEGAYYAAPLLATDKLVKLQLQAAFTGTGDLSLLPLAATQIDMQSPWAHPKFAGSNLPQSRQVQDSGFKASWSSGYMNENNQQYLQQCLNRSDCKISLYPANNDWQAAALSAFNPVNVYTLSDRAIKYSLLFVLMVFGVFGLFEILKDLRVHPVQYGLVGAALAVFYLLLLSLSEHVGFTLAYVIAAAACVLLISCYVAAILHSWLRASVLTVLLLGMYSVLYFLLHTSEWTLILGSGLVFVVLASIMLLTRKLDWYGLEQRHLYRPSPQSESE